MSTLAAIDFSEFEPAGRVRAEVERLRPVLGERVAAGAAIDALGTN